jgi:hypothetical protein
MPPALLFLLRIASAIWGLLYDFKINVYLSVKNGIGIFLRIVLNL